MVDDFIDRKHGRKKLAWPHEDYQLDILQPVLEPTYGIILYQEQVIQIAQVMGGFSLGGADILRRAMGKKKAEEMAKQRSVFLAGCVDNEIDEGLAGNIFDLVEKFAGYGFNKSHSAAYALLSYQTAWLKTHHGAAFMAAVLSSDMDNTDKVVIFKEECDAMGVTVLPPDINRSQVRFTVVDDKTILYGLGAIKGVGEAALANVLKERDENGEFADLDDLCRRADQGSVNKRVLEALIRSGAADALGPNRASLAAHLADALHGADQYHRNQDAGQVDLFGLDDAAPAAVVSRANVDAWPDRIRLKAEKETLGLYLSGHPIEEFQAELAKFTKGDLKALCAMSASNHNAGQPAYRQRGKPVVAAGLVIGVRFRDVQGGKMGFITLDDKTSRVEITLRGDIIDSSAHLIQKDDVLVVEGEISPDDFNGGHKIKAAEIYDMAKARARFARRLIINLSAGQLTEAGLQDLLKTLSTHNRGTTPVLFNYKNQQASASIQAGRQWAVNPQQELIAHLNQLAGENSVELVY